VLQVLGRGNLNSISTAPAILQPLLEILRQPAENVPYEKVVELASYDGAIAAQCLRLANSPLFGCRQIETVRAAIGALGIERMRSMLFGVCVNQVIPKNKWVLDPVAFWRHSLGCALVTQRMAKGIGHPEPDKAYLAGLLHDLGFLVNSILHTEDFRQPSTRRSTFAKRRSWGLLIVRVDSCCVSIGDSLRT
jgi:HD-like signal output (HDOD) protein